MAVTNTISNKDDIETLLFNDPFAVDDTNDLDIFGAPITKKATALEVMQFVKRALGSATTIDDCVVGTTGNLNATYSNGTLGVGATLTNAGTQAALIIDGRTMSAGTDQRVFVWQQSNQAQNGVYYVSNVGSVSTNWVLTRATDYDTSAEITLGTCISILGGSTLLGTTFIMYTADAITVGTTSILFKQPDAVLLGSTNSLTVSGNGNLIVTIAADSFITLPSGTKTLVASGDNVSFGTITSNSLTFNTGTGLKTGTSDPSTYVISVYDTDAAVHKIFGTAIGTLIPNFQWSQPAGGLLTWDGGAIGGTTPAAGAFTTLTSNSHTFNDGTGIKTSLVAGNTALITAYDVDGTAHKTFATLTANNTPTFDISPPSGGLVSITKSVGTGGTNIIPSGLLTSNFTPVLNITTGETDLMTYTLAANTFIASNQLITHEFRGQFTSSINAKTLKVYFGSATTVSNSLPASTAGNYYGKLSIIRTGTDTQNWNYEFTRTATGGGTAILTASGTCTETETANIVMKLTGTGGASSEISQTYAEINTKKG